MASSTPASKPRDVKFSQIEEALLGLLPLDGTRVDSRTLVQRYYEAKGEPPPHNARINIVGRIRGLAEKAERANLPWRIRKTARSGPKPQSFWRVPK